MQCPCRQSGCLDGEPYLHARARAESAWANATRSVRMLQPFSTLGLPRPQLPARSHVAEHFALAGRKLELIRGLFPTSLGARIESTTSFGEQDFPQSLAQRTGVKVTNNSRGLAPKLSSNAKLGRSLVDPEGFGVFVARRCSDLRASKPERQKAT